MSAIGKDQQLQNVMQAIQTGHWIDPKIKDFSKFKDEFSIYDGLILRQNHIIMPATLCQKTIAIAHQAHQGLAKSIARKLHGSGCSSVSCRGSHGLWPWVRCLAWYA